MNLSIPLFFVFLLSLTDLFISPVKASDVLIEKRFIRSQFLDTLFVKPITQRKLPLIILTHGDPTTAEERKKHTPRLYLPQARALASLGYAVTIVERRGFGASREVYAEGSGRCLNKNFDRSIHETNKDLEAVYHYYRSLPEIDPTKIVLMGKSAGGYASIQFSRKNLPGIKGVVNFAGGRASDGKGGICELEKLNRTFADAGRESQTKQLWIYSANDLWFPPQVSRGFFKSFQSGGGKGEYWEAPAYEKDGHHLFSSPELWIQKVSPFLLSIFS